MAAVSSQDANRIVVKNLPVSYDAEQLQALCAPFGTVTELPFVSENRRLKGKFGFVNFSTAAAAQAAISKLHGKELDGSSRPGGLQAEIATTKAATPKPEGAAADATGDKKKRRSKKSASEQGSDAAAAAAPAKRGRQPRAAAAEPQGEPEPSNRVFIRNLPRSYTAEELTALLSSAASLKGEVFLSSNSRISGHFAFAEFSDVAAAKKAIDKFNGKELEGQGKPGGLVVQFAREQAAAAAAAGGAAAAPAPKKTRGRGAAAAEGGAAAAPAERAPRVRKPRTRSTSEKKERDTTPQEPAPPAARLYVANLPTNFDSDALKALMSKAGKVTDECFVSSNSRLTGRFGFVVFENVATATKALEQFNGKELEGQGREGGLVVQYAREGKGLPPAAGAAAAGGAAAGGRRRGRPEKDSTPKEPVPCPRVFASNIPRDFTAEQVQALFASAGKIVDEVFISENRQLSGKFGFINYQNVDQATAAIRDLSGKELPNQGREGGLIVQFATSKGANTAAAATN